MTTPTMAAANVAVKPKRAPRVYDYSGLVPYVPPDGMPTAVLVDLDGTLCKMNGRGPYDEHLVGTDLPNEPVRAAVYGLANAGHRIIFLSGRGRRPETRAVTEQWLARHWRARYEALYMRDVGDSRVDWEIKYDLFGRHIRDRYRVLCVFDDRNQVVNMWRAIGVTVFQVADGDF